MNTNQSTPNELLFADPKTRMQTFSMVVVMALLILTSYGNAGLMFWLSLATMMLLSIWFLADRKIWLAVISSITFIACAFAVAKSLF